MFKGDSGSLHEDQVEKPVRYVYICDFKVDSSDSDSECDSKTFGHNEAGEPKAVSAKDNMEVANIEASMMQPQPDMTSAVILNESRTNQKTDSNDETGFTRAETTSQLLSINPESSRPTAKIIKTIRSPLASEGTKLPLSGSTEPPLFVNLARQKLTERISSLQTMGSENPDEIPKLSTQLEKLGSCETKIHQIAQMYNGDMKKADEVVAGAVGIFIRMLEENMNDVSVDQEFENLARSFSLNTHQRIGQPPVCEVQNGENLNINTSTKRSSNIGGARPVDLNKRARTTGRTSKLVGLLDAAGQTYKPGT